LSGSSEGPGGCGSVGQYGGVYCHTPNDDCFNDNDCIVDGGAINQYRVCVYSSEVGKWTCDSPRVCSG
jgi:hypothetical protein